MIQAVIAKPDVMTRIKRGLDAPIAVDLPQGFELLFMSEQVINDIHAVNPGTEVIEPFEYLDTGMSDYLTSICIDDSCVYLETDYFGGTGIQCAAFFSQGTLVESLHSSSSVLEPDLHAQGLLWNAPINTMFRRMGIIREPGLDEFDSMNMGEYRRIPG